MSFCNKLGVLLRTSAPSPMASMLNSFRCMSGSKLFVGGLSWGTDDQTLKEAFTTYGEVVEARVIMDRDSGRSRGFGFVSFANDASATEAVSSMDGQDLQGRNIRVSYANERAPRSDNYQGGGGGYNGGGGGYNSNY